MDKEEIDLLVYGRYKGGIIKWNYSVYSICQILDTYYKSLRLHTSATRVGCTEASPEDILWIEECIKQGMFIPKEELSSEQEHYDLY